MHSIYILGSFKYNLATRIDQHRSGAVNSFSRTYKTFKLVYVEIAESAESAFARERQIKNWRRDKKVALIEKTNPNWEDLFTKAG